MNTGPCSQVFEKTDISSFGVAVRSEYLGNATELVGSAEEVDGEALGVGVDATDNLDPPLW